MTQTNKKYNARVILLKSLSLTSNENNKFQNFSSQEQKLLLYLYLFISYPISLCKFAVLLCAGLNTSFFSVEDEFFEPTLLQNLANRYKEGILLSCSVVVVKHIQEGHHFPEKSLFKKSFLIGSICSSSIELFLYKW